MNENDLEILKQETIENVLNWLADNGKIEPSEKYYLFDKILNEVV